MWNETSEKPPEMHNGFVCYDRPGRMLTDNEHRNIVLLFERLIIAIYRYSKNPQERRMLLELYGPKS